MPRQTAYNLPLEIVYTIVPFLIIAVLFFFTVVVQDKVKKRSAHPDETVAVHAFKWNWQFVYPNTNGPDGQPVNTVGSSTEIPILVLPTDQDDPLRAVVVRRHPLLLGAGVPLQARRDPGQRERPQQRLRGHRPQDGGLRGPLRRAVRHLPRVHELRGAFGVAGDDFDAYIQARESGHVDGQALEKIGQPGHATTTKPLSLPQTQALSGQTTGG